MSDKKIRIVVGASLDRSALDVFAPLKASAKKARTAIDGEMKASGKATGSNFREGALATNRVFEGMARDAKKANKAMDREMKAAADAIERNMQRARANADREYERIARAAERAGQRMQRAAVVADQRRERARARQAEKDVASAGRGVMRAGGIAFGAAKTAVSFGARVAGDVARGAGADLDVASQVGKAGEAQTTITNLANSGYMAGASGANGVRQSDVELMKELSKEATDTGFSTNAAAEGLAKFVGKTGDLDTGRKAFKDLAILSRATGTELEHMVDAAGDVANGLGDIPNKAEVINKVMRQIAGEGKLGAVEISALATQMAKVAASAGKFEGNQAQTIGTFGMLAQEARANGGASSATQAATSLMSFSAQFSKNARQAKFEQYGVKTQGDGGIRDPREIIIDSIKAAEKHSGGSTNRQGIIMGSMFADAGARKVTAGFEKIYNNAGGGQSGEDAVRAEMKRLEQVALEQEEITESFNRSMKTAEAQANAFNNQLEMAAGELRDSLTPAAAALAPILIGAANDFAAVVAKFTGSKDRADANTAEGVRTAVDGDIVNTNRSIARGEISAEQLAKNKRDMYAAGQSALATSSDATAGKANMYGGAAQLAMKGADLMLNAGGLGMVFGGSKGTHLGGEAIERDKQEQRAREDVAKRAAETYANAQQSWNTVADYMKNGTLKVQIVSDTTKGGPKSPPQGPAAVPAGGDG